MELWIGCTRGFEKTKFRLNHSSWNVVLTNVKLGSSDFTRMHPEINLIDTSSLALKSQLRTSQIEVRNFKFATLNFSRNPVTCWNIFLKYFRLHIFSFRKRAEWQKPVINKQISVRHKIMTFHERKSPLTFFHFNSDEWKREISVHINSFFPFHGNYAIFAVHLHRLRHSKKQQEKLHRVIKRENCNFNMLVYACLHQSNNILWFFSFFFFASSSLLGNNTKKMCNGIVVHLWLN